MDGIQNVIRDVVVVKAAVSELATVSKQVLRGLFKARLDDLRKAEINIIWMLWWLRSVK